MTMQPTFIDTKRPGLRIILAGLATSALALFLVSMICSQTEGDVYVMGWYANYVIPIGALLVGMLAGSGYGFASWLTGVRIRKDLLWTVVGLQILTYFAARYVEFRSYDLVSADGSPLRFWAYFDAVTRAFAFNTDRGTPGEPLGLGGYAFVGLELTGFSVGGVLAPLICSKMPYCHDCQCYMKRRALCVIPAGVQPTKVKKKDLAGQQAHATAAQHGLQSGIDQLLTLQNAAQENDILGLCAHVQELKPGSKLARKLTGRIAVSLVACPICSHGHLASTLLQGSGETVSRQNLEVIPLTPAAVCDLRN